MNALLKKALLAKFGTHKVEVGCNSFCNSWEYQIGAKWLNIWHYMANGNANVHKRLEIDEDLAERIADVVAEYDYSDARRVKAIIDMFD